MLTPDTSFRLLLIKSGPGSGSKIAHQSGYAYYGSPARWHKITANKPAPKGAPVAAHPEAAGSHSPAKHFSDAEWAQLKLPDSNVNAPSFNKAIDKLKEWSDAGNVTAIVGAGYGSNTYGKRLALIANKLLAMHGSSHTVTAGQKAGTHGAVQAQEPAGVPAQVAEHIDQLVASGDAAHAADLYGPDSDAKPAVKAYAAKKLAVDAAVDHLEQDSKQADIPAAEHADDKKAVEEIKDAPTVDAALETAKQHVKEDIAEGVGGAAEGKQDKALVDKLEAAKDASAADAGTYEHNGTKKPIPNKDDGTGTLSPASTGWLHAYQWGIDGTGDGEVKNPIPSDAVLAELAPFVGKSPVKLYRAVYEGADDSGKLVESWTRFEKHASDLVAANAELSKKMKVVSQVFQPEQIIVDTTKLPKKFNDAHDAGTQAEVVVALGSFAEHLKAVKSGAVDAGPKEGDTKPAADGGTLVLKDGHWVKQGEPAPTGNLSMPDFQEGKTTTGVKALYEKTAQKLMDHAHAGNLSVVESMPDPSKKMWQGKTPNSKKLVALHAEAMASLKGSGVPGVDPAAPEPDPAAGPTKLGQIPWAQQMLPTSNTNAASHNKAVSKIKAMAEAGDVAGLQAFADSKAGAKQTYAKKQGLLAQLALAALKEDSASAPAAAAPAPAAAAPVPDAEPSFGPDESTPVPLKYQKFMDYWAEVGDQNALQTMIANNKVGNPHLAAYAQKKLDEMAAPAHQLTEKEKAGLIKWMIAGKPTSSHPDSWSNLWKKLSKEQKAEANKAFEAFQGKPYTYIKTGPGGLGNEGPVFHVDGDYSAMAKLLGLPDGALDEDDSETFTVKTANGETYSVYKHGGGLTVRTSGTNYNNDGAKILMKWLEKNAPEKPKAAPSIAGKPAYDHLAQQIKAGAFADATAEKWIEANPGQFDELNEALTSLGYQHLATYGQAPSDSPTALSQAEMPDVIDTGPTYMQDAYADLKKFALAGDMDGVKGFIAGHEGNGNPNKEYGPYVFAKQVLAKMQAKVVTADTPLGRKQLEALESLSVKELKGIQGLSSLPPNVSAWVDKKLAELEPPAALTQAQEDALVTVLKLNGGVMPTVGDYADQWKGLSAEKKAELTAKAAKKPAKVKVSTTLFENTLDGHNKFWSVSTHGTSMKTEYGKIGTMGTSTLKTFPTAEAAKAAAAKLIKQKQAKGYQLKGWTDHEYDAPAGDAAVEQGPKEGDTKQGTNGMLVFKNGRWHKQGEAAPAAKKLTPSMITAAFNGPVPANQFITAAKKAAKAGDAAGINAAWWAADAKGFAKTTAAIGKLAAAMGVEIKPQGQADAAEPAAAPAGKPQKPQLTGFVDVVNEIEGYIDQGNTEKLADAITSLTGLNSKNAKAAMAYAQAGQAFLAGAAPITSWSYDKGDPAMNGHPTLTSDHGVLAWNADDSQAEYHWDGMDYVNDEPLMALSLQEILQQMADNGFPLPSVADVQKLDPDFTASSMPGAKKPAPAAAAPAPGTKPSMDAWVQTGPQKGSNPGGKFKDPSGQEWYCKWPSDTEAAKSEVLAAKLYALAGLSSQDCMLVTKGGKTAIATKWTDIKKASSATALSKVDGVLSGFAVDAWLGNWDVVGLSLDNLQIGPDGKAHRVDAGGSLEYRAQGEKKPFGATVDEIDTLRDKSKNEQAAAVFGKMTQADIIASVAKVAAISDVAIRAMVNEHGPGDEAAKKKLADTLIARKKYLLSKYPQAAKAKKKHTFKPEKISEPPSFLNWGGSGKSGPSSKQFLNQANEDAVQAIYAAAKTGDLDAVKNLTAPVYDKDSGKVTGHKSVLEHPSQHVKGYAQQAINEINYQLNPPKRFRFDGGHPLHALNNAYPAHKGQKSSQTAQKLGKFIVLGEPGIVKLEEVGLPPTIKHAEAGGTLSNATYSPAAKAAFTKMPATQKQAIQSYTGSSYHAMNGSLWSGNPSGAAKAAGEALKTLGHDIAPGTVLSRKISLHGEDLNLLLNAKGKVLEEPAIMSTSIRPSSWSGNVHLKLHVGPGVKGLWVGPGSNPGGGAVSKNAGEDEMILPPNTRLLIISVKPGGKDADGFGSSSSHVIEAVILPTQ